MGEEVQKRRVRSWQLLAVASRAVRIGVVVVRSQLAVVAVVVRSRFAVVAVAV
jgi:hypothetical protein